LGARPKRLSPSTRLQNYRQQDRRPTHPQKYFHRKIDSARATLFLIGEKDKILGQRTA
jgi:hypothetical protein